MKYVYLVLCALQVATLVGSSGDNSTPLESAGLIGFAIVSFGGFLIELASEISEKKDGNI